jgi:acyl-homoserine-lactone acylase
VRQLLVVLVGALRTAAAPVEGSGALPEPWAAEVLWDTWGVPHVYSDTELGLCFGFGYAHGRDHGPELLEIAAIAAGRSAEFMGATPWEALDISSYVDRVPQSSQILYGAMDNTTAARYVSFAAGFSAYTLEHPEEYPRSEGFNQMLPLSGLDWFRANMRVLFSFAFSGASSRQAGVEQRWAERNVTDDPNRRAREAGGRTYSAYELWDPLSWSGVTDEQRETLGSNAWAIDGTKSSGNPMLNINPHLPFSGFFRWYEAQLVCEACEIDIYGANLIGMPGLTIGWNPSLGWTHTVNAGTPFAGFELELNPEDDNQYRFDGDWLTFDVEENVVKTLLPDGGYAERVVVTEYSVHGAIVSRGDGVAMAARLAGIDTTVKRAGSVKQWWDMGKARTLSEFKDAMRELQIPMYYTAVATAEGDIMINWNAWVPDRGEASCSLTQSQVRIVDGSSSDTLWNDVLAWDELPTVENPAAGFVQNANEAPWTMAAPIGEGLLDPSKYCQYLVGDASLVPWMGYRPQVSWRLMVENDDIDFDEFLRLKMSTSKEATQHVLDDLLAAVAEFGGEDLDEAAAVLTSWDREMETTSVGSFLFESFLSSVPASALFVNEWSAADPLGTPSTLANPEAAVDGLRTAVAREAELGRPLDVEFGAVNRLPVGAGGETAPGNGCSDCFRNARYTNGLINTGDSFVGLVEFTPGGARARASVAYGNASPASRGAVLGHLNDQMELFSAKQLRDVWSQREEVEDNLEERAVVTQRLAGAMMKSDDNDLPPDAPGRTEDRLTGHCLGIRQCDVGSVTVGLKSDDESSCAVSEVLGCYADCGSSDDSISSLVHGSAAPPCRKQGEHRLLGTFTSPADIKTQEHCLEACCQKGIAGTEAVVGVEDSGQCFCADSFSPPTTTKRPATECASPCSGNATQQCGKESRIVVLRGMCKRPCKAPPPLPLASTTTLVFNSSITPAGSKYPVNCYRGPAIVQTPSALVAFAEGRVGYVTNSSFKPSCDDCVQSGIATRRSTDGGRSWGSYSWALRPESWAPSLPHTTKGAGGGSALYDPSTKKLFVQFNRGYMANLSRVDNKHYQLCNPAGANWQMESTDGGATYSTPKDISAALTNWSGSLVNFGIVLQGKGQQAQHRGRLVWTGHFGMYGATLVWYSDDGGSSYKLSETTFPHMDESTLAELEDGTVYLSMRNNHYANNPNGSSCHCRGYARSTDGGATFGALGFDPALISPVCQASLSTAGGALLFANPANGGDGFASDRSQGTIKKSEDGGKTWSASLYVTPLGVSAVDGGSYDYSNLVQEPMHDDPSVGGLMWAHQLPGAACNTNPPSSQGCYQILFSRFPLNFSSGEAPPKTTSLAAIKTDDAEPDDMVARRITVARKLAVQRAVFNLTVLDSRHLMLQTTQNYSRTAARLVSNYQLQPPIAVRSVGLRQWVEGYYSRPGMPPKRGDADPQNVLMGYYIYLVLGDDLVSGKEYRLQAKLASNVSGHIVTGNVDFAHDYNSDSASSTIKVNQIGFLPIGPKVAYVGNWLGDLGPMLAPAGRMARVLDLNSVNATVFGPTMMQHRNQSDCPQKGHCPVFGEDLWAFNFSSLTKPGRYVVQVEHTGISFPFQIATDVYRAAATTTMRALWFQREGIDLDEKRSGQWARKAGQLNTSAFYHNSIKDVSPELYAGEQIGSYFNSSGGWDDASDFNKYLGNGVISVAQWLLLYEWIPERFSDGELNIAESGDGIPDLLSEAAWELEWIATMVSKNGCAFAKVSHHSWASWGTMPHQDERKMWAITKTTVDTAGAAAVLAKAARIFQRWDPAKAKRYQLKAELAWTCLAKHPTQYPNVTEKDKNISHFCNPLGDDALGIPEVRTGCEWWIQDKFAWDGCHRIWAMLELWLLTGNETYHDLFLEKMRAAEMAAVHGCMIAGYGSGQPYAQVTLFPYLRAPTGDATIKKTMRKYIREVSNFYAKWMDGSMYNTPLKDTTMMGFGTLAMSTRYALGFLLDYEATNRTESQLLHRAQSCVDYQLGANPQSMSFITGLGSKYPMHPQHQISEWDGVVEPVPGISVYGAADGFPFKYLYEPPRLDAYPPFYDGYPRARHYLDQFGIVLNGEFTITDLTAVSAVFGYLSQNVSGSLHSSEHGSGHLTGSLHVSASDDDESAHYHTRPQELIPNDWRSGTAAGRVLFTDTPASIWPELANGYVGFRPQATNCCLENRTACSPLFVTGLYNGLQYGPSQRVALPRYKFTAVHAEAQHTRQAWALDMERGIFTERTQSACGTPADAVVTIAQQHYAHRDSRHVAVHNVTIMNGCPHEVSVELDCGWVAQSEGVQLSSRFAGDDDFVAMHGSTLATETADMPRVHVAVVATACVRETLRVAPGRTEERTMLSAAATSLPNDNAGMNATAVLDSALQAVRIAMASPALLATHEAAWRQLWSAGRIEVPQGPAGGEDATQELAQLVNASMFQLLSSVRSDWPAGLSGVGIASSAYHGAVFWGTDTWIYPVFAALQPSIARDAILQYRVDRLDAARVNAHRDGLQGAKYPWMSGASGVETCADGGAEGHWAKFEVHIAGDVANAVRQYFVFSGDDEWLQRSGWPVVEGCAQYWASRARNIGDGTGSGYTLDGVMGPDESVWPVNSSAFTNAVAAQTLEFAAQAAPATAPRSQLAHWRQVASGLRKSIPFDAASQRHPEFDGYDGGMIKQADTVLMQYPLEMPMPMDVRINDLEYYEARTSDRVSMNWQVYSIAEQRARRPLRAWELLSAAARNATVGPFLVWQESIPSRIGLHTFLPGAGGFLQALMFGFGGLSTAATTSPCIALVAPAAPAGISFSLHGVQFRGASLRIEVRSSDATVQVLSGADVQLVRESDNATYALHPNGPVATMAIGTSVLVCPAATRATQQVDGGAL